MSFYLSKYGANRPYNCFCQTQAYQFMLMYLYSKWKADKRGVYAMALGPTEDQLLSAGRTIKLWDLVKYELLQVSLVEILSQMAPSSFHIILHQEIQKITSKFEVHVVLCTSKKFIRQPVITFFITDLQWPLNGNSTVVAGTKLYWWCCS